MRNLLDVRGRHATPPPDAEWRSSVRRAWLFWVTLGEFFGFAFPATVGAVSVGWAPVPAAAALLAAGAVEGSLLDAAQAHVLRRVLPALPRGRFVAAQWWVVRHVAHRSAAWIPATAAAWAAGLLAFTGVATPLWQPGQPVLLVIAIGALGGLVMVSQPPRTAASAGSAPSSVNPCAVTPAPTAHAALTEPSNSPATPPCPRLPTTRMRAPSLASRRTRAAPP